MKQIYIALSLFIGLLSLQLLYDALVSSKYLFHVPHLLAVIDWAIFLYGPLFLFIVSSLCNREFKLKPWHLLHLGPLIWYLAQIYGIYLEPLAIKKRIISDLYADLESVNAQSTNVVMVLLVATYFLAGAGIITASWIRKAALQKINRQEQVQYVLLLTFVVVCMVALVRTIFFFGPETILIDSSLLAGLFYAFSYVLMMNPHAFKQQVRIKSSLGMDPDLHTRFQQYISSERPFLDPEISLSKAALAVGCHPRKLSEVVNQQYWETFLQHLNRHRVAQAQKLLTEYDPTKFSMDKVIQESGFSSKSGFYRAFKHFTKITPGEFMQKIQSQ